MSVSEKDINTALSSRLQEIQNAGVPPIAWENAPYTPTTDVLYLQETFMPNIKSPVGIENSSVDDYQGMYQVLVVDTRGNRRFAAQEQARLLAVHFPRGGTATYNGVSVEITGSRIQQGFSEQNNYYVPVTVTWRALS